MKSLLILGLAMMLAVVGLAWGENYRYEQAWNPENLIRLHVVAHSDQEEDQRVKLEVRDAVLQQLSPVLQQMEHIQEADAYLQGVLPQLEQQLAQMPELGEHTITARLVTDWFPDKTYGELALPAGQYHALRIEIGQGTGANWWCLLFPPLCLVDAAIGYEEAPEWLQGVHLISEEDLPQPPTKIRWAIWEFLSKQRWFQRNR